MIASQWVLTAAHCMYINGDFSRPWSANQLRVVLGEHDLTISTESKIPKIEVKVEEIIKHSEYDEDTSDNDVALLKLTTEVDLDTYTPVCLPKATDSFIGKRALVYGKCIGTKVLCPSKR